MGSEKCGFAVKALIVGGIIGALLIVILIPMSFSAVEYHQFGFVRQKSTGTVNTTKVYSGGKYFIGPDYEFKVFKADTQFITLDNVAVFTSDKLEVSITVFIQYSLRKDELPLLHKQFDLYYEEIVKNSAIDALKGAVPVYSTRQLILNRVQVQETINKAISERLGGICCRPGCPYNGSCESGCTPYERCADNQKGLFLDVKGTQLGKVVIPDDVENRFLRALILQEESAREELYQEAQVVRKETEKIVAQIRNDAQEIKQNATVLSEYIGTISKANYTATIESARAVGLKRLFSDLSITDQKYKSSFDYLRTLKDLSNIYLTVDFQQRIAGSFGSGSK
ncbi:hypothetical protein CHS0354_031438 [Potamilus streckersoni]|uniref:Band 7 domain-containing protein n=1 Tax=Potamilus streckersoni TaxID=2493646 RepID=A0AAE0SH56_9BIVA|nr:hypothetical protein CHS0354_031438 [Potamilus streckersoni]